MPGTVLAPPLPAAALTPANPARERLLQGFGAVSPPDALALDALAQVMQPRRVPRGAMLFAAHERRHCIGWVDEGLLRLFHLDAQGGEYSKVFFKPGSWFVSGFDASLPGTLCLQASVDALVWLCDVEAHDALLRCHPSLALAHIGLLRRHIALKHWREVALLTLSGTERYQRFRALYAEWVDRIPQAHVASHIGLTPTQLSRIRRKLGLIGAASEAPAR